MSQHNSELMKMAAILSDVKQKGQSGAVDNQEISWRSDASFFVAAASTSLDVYVHIPLDACGSCMNWLQS